MGIGRITINTSIDRFRIPVLRKMDCSSPHLPSMVLFQKKARGRQIKNASRMTIEQYTIVKPMRICVSIRKLRV